MIKSKAVILYVSYDGLSDPLGQAQVLPYIENLTAKGYKFHILSAEKDKTAIPQLDARLKEKGIGWTPVLYHKKPPVLSTLYDLHKMYKAGLKIIDTEEVSIVHTRSYLPQILFTKWKKKFPLLKSVFDIRGFWIDERIEGNIWPYKHIYKVIVDYLRRLEPELYKSASQVVTLTTKAKEILAEGLYPYKDKISVIPCSTGLELPEIDKDKLKSELGLAGRYPILVYSGSVGTWYMVKEMLDFFAVVKKHYPQAAFLFLSKVDKQELIRISGEKVAENDLVVKFVNRSDVMKYLQIADAGLFFIKPLWSKQASSPTKMGEMLAAGLPVIANDIGDVGRIIEKYDCGVVVNRFDDDEYERIAGDFDKIRGKGNDKARFAAAEVFSMGRAVEKYAKVYASLIG